MAYTTIDDPSVYFQTALYTGDGASSNAITNGGNSDLQPDWLWIKNRSSSGGTGPNIIFDSTRGPTKDLHTNNSETEHTNSNTCKSFNTDGFTVGDSGAVNNNTDNFVAWQWKANGGSRTTFSESGSNAGGGYQVNTTAGFSIIDYTGTGSAGATITHGLGATPEFFVVKGRSIGDSWTSYHHKNTSAPETDMLKLDENGATQDNVVFFNDTAPTSTVFTVDGAGGESKVNQDGETYIAYCFRSIQGYSKIGSYTGNGNTDGTFVYTGFKPAWLLIKRTDSAKDWYLYDNKRNTFNRHDTVLVPNGSGADLTTDNYVDFLSNGFKLRGSSSVTNSNGGTYVYLAFAEHPFVSSEGVPTTAR